MAGGSSVVGTLKAILAMDTADFESGAARATKTAQSTERTLSDLGKAIGAAFSIQQFSQLSAEVVTATSHIDDMAKKMGIGVEAVQELGYAAKQSGGDIDQISQAMALMGSRLVGGEATKALKDIGLSIVDLRKLTPDEAFTKIATAISKIPDPMERSRRAIEIFGRSGANLLPVLTSNIAGLREEARRTGAVMSGDLVEAGDKVGDSWDAMKQRVEALKGQALIPLLEVFVSMPTSMQAVLGVASEFSGVLSGIGIAVMAAGGPVAALTALKTAASAAGTAITAFAATPVGAALIATAALGVGIAKLNHYFDDLVEGVNKSSQALHENSPWKKLVDDAVPSLGSADAAMREFNISNKENEERIKKNIAAWESWNESVRRLADSWNGADLATKAKMLAEAYNKLTPAEKANADVMERVAKDADELQKAGAKLVPELDKLAKRHAGVAAAADLQGKMTNLLSGITGHYGTILQDMTHRVDATEHNFNSLIVKTKDLAAAFNVTGQAILTLPDPPSEGWRHWATQIDEILGGVSGSISRGLTDMIGHWSHHASLLKEIWQGIKNTFLNVIDEMLQKFLVDFLGGMLKGILDSNIGGALAGLFGGGGSGGLFGGLTGLIGGGGAGAGTIVGGTAPTITGGGIGGGLSAAGIGTAASWAAGALAPWAIGSLLTPGPHWERYLTSGQVTEAYQDYFGDNYQSFLPDDTSHVTPGDVPWWQGMPQGSLTNETVPGFAMGTGGKYWDFGAGTLAMLHGPEMIVPKGEGIDAAAFGGGADLRPLILQVDGRTLGRVMFNPLAREAQRLQVASL